MAIPCPKHPDARHVVVDETRNVQHPTCSCGLVFDPRWNEPTREEVIAATEPTAEQVAAANAHPWRRGAPLKLGGGS